MKVKDLENLHKERQLCLKFKCIGLVLVFVTIFNNFKVTVKIYFI